MQARGLDIDWAMECVPALYYELSCPTFFNGGPITVRDVDFGKDNRAILVTLLKLQSNWPHPLEWTEKTSLKKR